MYAQQTVNVRDLPDTSGNKLGSLSINDEITITGQCNETGWYRFEYNGSVAYVSNKYVGENKVELQQTATPTDNDSNPKTSTNSSSPNGYFYQNDYGQTLTMTYDEAVAEASKKYPMYQLIDNGSNQITIYYICTHFRENPTMPPYTTFVGNDYLDSLFHQAEDILEQRGYSDWVGSGDRFDYFDGHNYSVNTQVFTGQ